MANQIPVYIAQMMAERSWRMHHYLWHEVRNGWLFFDAQTQDQIRNLGWEPPRPAQRPSAGGRPEIILDNKSGEDFLYMHRQMIDTVNQRLAGDASYPRVEGWQTVPSPTDSDYPVPPAWDAGDNDFNDFLTAVKSQQDFDSTFTVWESQYTDAAQLRQMSLGEFGARLEFTIHNRMHMRWCAEPATTGIRPDVEPGTPDAIDIKWDAVAYDWLGDTYSSHVNSVFWKLHGWIDNRINDWASANNAADPIPWQGTWLGKRPTQPPHHSFLSALSERFGSRDASVLHSGHHHDLEEMHEVARVLAKTGHFCHFYDQVLIP
jgi:hypothetical protein